MKFKYNCVRSLKLSFLQFLLPKMHASHTAAGIIAYLDESGNDLKVRLDDVTALSNEVKITVGQFDRIFFSSP